jgi:hypothetical protein
MAHNLGSFDGLFLYKALFKYVESKPRPSLPGIEIEERQDYKPNYSNIKCLLDPSKSFITISYKNNNVTYTWKDSMRIFPFSLNTLCKMFGVTGKSMTYNPE